MISITSSGQVYLIFTFYLFSTLNKFIKSNFFGINTKLFGKEHADRIWAT